MNLATRILGVAIVASTLAGATYGAFQTFGTEPQLTSVTLQDPNQQVTLLAGQASPFALGAQNEGDTDVDVVLEARTDGFSFRTRSGPQAVGAGNTTQLRGALEADDSLEGDYDVEFVATDNATGEQLDTLTVPVTVSTPSAPQLSLTPILPAVVPGEEAKFTLRLKNNVGATQRVNVSVVGGPGTVDPRRVPLRPNATGSATVTVPIPDGATGDHEVTVEAENEAGKTTTASASVSVVPDGEVRVEALKQNARVEPGNRYTVPVVAVSNADVSGDVSATGEDVVATNFTSIEPRNSTGGFVTFQVPGDAGSSLQHSATIDVAGQNHTVQVAVTTTLGTSSPREGQEATVEFVGRLPNGSVVGTSIPAVAEGPFDRSEDFQGGRQVRTMTVRPGAVRQQAPSGVVQAVENMTLGESQTVTLAPEDAFGPERRTQEREATTELQRSQEVPRMLEDIPKNRLPPEFDIENKTEGDVIAFNTTAGDVPITLRFELTKKTEDVVSLRRMAEEGDTITFYAPWPNATEVTKANETTIVYTTTPPESATNGPFTWDANPDSHKAKWGNTTRVETVNETAILLRHQPEEGLEYEASAGRFGQTRSFRVENVTRDTITLSTPNQHPFAGQTITYDLTVLDISEAQQRRRPPGLGGG